MIDSIPSNAIPGHDALYQMTRVLFEKELPAQASILVIGPGTGVELATLLSASKQWQATIVEEDATVANTAKANLERVASQVAWHHGTIDSLRGDKAFDAAIHFFALHRIKDDQQIDHFALITEWLEPGAWMVLASYFGDVETNRYRRMAGLHKLYALSAGMDAAQAEKEFQPTRPDLSIPSEELLKTRLRQAGFAEVQRFFQAFRIGGWLARINR